MHALFIYGKKNLDYLTEQKYTKVKLLNFNKETEILIIFKY